MFRKVLMGNLFSYKVRSLGAPWIKFCWWWHRDHLKITLPGSQIISELTVSATSCPVSGLVLNSPALQVKPMCGKDGKERMWDVCHWLLFLKDTADHGGCGEYLWISAWGMSTFAVRIISFTQRIWYSGFWQSLCLPGTFLLVRVPWTV